MHLHLDGEEDLVAADVRVIVRVIARMPQVPGELPIRGREERVALTLVLADEHDERSFGAVRELGVPPPPGVDARE